MKFTHIILFALFFVPLGLSAQDTLFMAKNGEKVKNRKLAESYQIIIPDTIRGNNSQIVRLYYLSGQIKSETHQIQKLDEKKNKKVYIKDGRFQSWYENGQLQWDIDYLDGKFNENLVTYWQNGKVKRKDTYKAGKLIEGKCFTEDGYESDYYEFEIMPKFPGGIGELLQFISRNLRYPITDQQAGIQGTVICRFAIDKNGNVKDIQVIRQLSPTTDAEASRVISILPRWVPGMQDGVAVPVYYTLPIKFRLSK